ncbi:MAG: Stf0 family sulfotransferase [Candidatus Udaeobacter sp.]
MNPAISYIITSVQRSGTHLLCSILRSTGIAGSPDEHFLSKPGETWEKYWGAPSRIAFVQNVLQQNTAANGVFGTVVMWSYFERMLQMFQEIPVHKNLNGVQLLAAIFGEPNYIWMRRRNHVEQAVSWAIACQTGVWTQKVREKSQPRAIANFNFKVIDEWCNRIAAHDEGWANYFRENQIEPLVVFYEDVVASHSATAERVLKFLGLPFAPGTEIPRPSIEKQATRISEEWAARYLKLKRTKAGTLARIIRRMRL